jgi:hypothetical protein
MEPCYTHTTKIGPAPKADDDGGNPWIHRWHYSDGSYRDVVVGALHRAG